jgi:hypothetical protein
MVAYNPRSPRDDNRTLSPEVAEGLRRSLAARWTDPEAYENGLSTALTAAAQEARERGMRPEELLLALKAIEEDVAETLNVVDTQDRDRFRFWLVRACMRAFFSEEPESGS